MEIGQKITLKIESIAFGGEGVARLNNRVIFVRNVIDGETVEAEIVEAKKNFCRAKLIKVLEKSPFRITPPCPYFSVCAGCQYQHIDYNHQLEIKRKQVAEVFKHIARLDILPEEVIPSPEIYNYRRLLKFHSVGGAVGFYTYDNKTLIDVHNCLLGEPLDDKRPILSYEVLGKKFSVPINSFFQTNRFLLGKMAENVIDFAKPKKDEVLFDCFSGVGFFSVFLAEKAAKVYGFEEGREASEIAPLNASINGINNFISIQGKTEKKLPELIKKIIPDTIILDPPRTGCHPKILELIGRHKIKKIVYVSCNPSTLARDIVILKDFGYKLEKIQPIDMFPQTSHIEVVSLLKFRLTIPKFMLKSPLQLQFLYKL